MRSPNLLNVSTGMMDWASNALSSVGVSLDVIQEATRVTGDCGVCARTSLLCTGDASRLETIDTGGVLGSVSSVTNDVSVVTNDVSAREESREGRESDEGEWLSDLV